MKHVAIIALVVSVFAFTSASPAYAGPGTAKKAGGIVLISVGSAVGGVTMLMGLIEKSCGSYDAACDRSQKNGDRLLLLGAAVIPASIVGGILLIREGREEQRLSVGITAPRRTGAGKAMELPGLKLALDF